MGWATARGPCSRRNAFHDNASRSKGKRRIYSTGPVTAQRRMRNKSVICTSPFRANARKKGKEAPTTARVLDNARGRTIAVPALGRCAGTPERRKMNFIFEQMQRNALFWRSPPSGRAGHGKVVSLARWSVDTRGSTGARARLPGPLNGRLMVAVCSTEQKYEGRNSNGKLKNQLERKSKIAGASLPRLADGR